MDTLIGGLLHWELSESSPLASSTFLSADARITLDHRPGVDPEKASFKRMTGKVSVQVVDWCSSRSIVRRFDSAAAFLEFLYDAQSERPSWSRARWINVDGLNWSVIRELAIRHKLQ